MNERRDLTAAEFGHAVSLLLACIWSEPDLSAWGEQHAQALGSIKHSHQAHYAAARDAFRARLRQLKGDQRD